VNLIKCSCGEGLFFRDKDQKYQEFKTCHKAHLIGKFKIYPGELLQIARNMNDRFRDEEATPDEL
jgi:hypothetical protein